MCYHAVMPRQLTIRGVPDEVGRCLQTLSRDKGKSVNSIVLEILETALGVHQRRSRLQRYVTWTAQDLKEFERILEAQRLVDKELWQ